MSSNESNVSIESFSIKNTTLVIEIEDYTPIEVLVFYDQDEVGDIYLHHFQEKLRKFGWKF